MSESHSLRLRVDLLRVDSLAGLTVGVTVLLLSEWLSDLYALPRSYVVVNAIANLAYGSYSGWLSRQPRRASALITALVIANAVWAVVCIGAAIVLADRASAIGLATLVFEALFVGTLAVLEWRYRDALTAPGARPRVGV